MRPSKRFGDDWRQPEIEHNQLTEWNWMVSYPENFTIEEGPVDIGAFTYINAKAGVWLERDVQIGSHCSIYSGSSIDGTHEMVHIKEGAAIGTHATVMPGVTIGRGAIVGAYAFVKEDVPDGGTAYGIPARVF